MVGLGQIEVFRGFGRISWRGNTLALLLVTTTNIKILDILEDHRWRVIQLYEVPMVVRLEKNELLELRGVQFLKRFSAKFVKFSPNLHPSTCKLEITSKTSSS